MTAREKCIRNIRDRKVKVEENGLKAIFENPDRQRFCKVHVDGCLVQNELIADYIVNKIGVGSVIIELKGTDAMRAYEQLPATAIHPACKTHIGRRKGMLIVCETWPETSTTKQRMEREATKRGFRLTVETKQVECRIEKLFFEEAAAR